LLPAKLTSDQNSVAFADSISPIIALPILQVYTTLADYTPVRRVYDR